MVGGIFSEIGERVDDRDQFPLFKKIVIFQSGENNARGHNRSSSVGGSLSPKMSKNRNAATRDRRCLFNNWPNIWQNTIY